MQVYSLVNKVARVTLYVNGENINEILLEKKLAERTEEDYMSKVCINQNTLVLLVTPFYQLINF